MTSAVNSLQEIATSLIDYAVHKLNAIKIDKKEIKKAKQLLKSASFDHYKEKWTTRLASFNEINTENVINGMANEYNWDARFVDGLKTAILYQLQDRRSDTWFEIVKGGENSFNVYYVMMTKIEDTVHFGLACGTVQFKLSPTVKPCYETQPFLWFFEQEVQVGSVKEERQISVKDKAVLEKYFQQTAVKRFMQDIPHNPIQLAVEEGAVDDITE